MTSSIPFAAGVALAALLAASPLQAKTLTFESIAPDGGLRNINPADPLITDGYMFSDVNGEAAVFAGNSGNNLTADTSSFVGFAPSDMITLTDAGSAPFNLMQLLLGPSSFGTGTTDITLTGFIAGSTMTETQSFIGLTTATLETLNWLDLSSVTITATTDSGFDDVVIAPFQGDVPEPASVALLGAGLLGLAGLIRRKA